MSKTKTYLTEMYQPPLVWKVRSQTVGESEYFVDLGGGESGHEHCQCKWYLCECGPKLRKGLTPSKMCVHYGLAKNAFTDWAIAHFREQDPNYHVKQI